MLFHPAALLALVALLALWAWALVLRGVDRPLELGGRVLGERDKVVALSVITLLVVALGGVASAFFTGLTLGGLAVAAHAVLRAPDDLFLDEPDSLGAPGGAGGFLGSLLGPPGPALPVVTTAGRS
eukprot:SM000021S06430  [mRNA]  locus=s21:275398:275775:+ [translate_table: standard]